MNCRNWEEKIALYVGEDLAPDEAAEVYNSRKVRDAWEPCRFRDLVSVAASDTLGVSLSVDDPVLVRVGVVTLATEAHHHGDRAVVVALLRV